MSQQQQGPEGNFEKRLGDELTAIVAERGAAHEPQGARGATQARPAWRRRGPRLGLAAAAVVAVAAAVLIIKAGGSDTPAAFALEATPEGIVNVEISRPEDAEGLEAGLGEAGIPASVSYLPAGSVCKEPRFRSVPWPQGARMILNAPGDGSGSISGPITFWVSSDAVGPGQTLVITASASAEGFFGTDNQMKIAIAEGTVAPCEPVPASGEEAAASGAGGRR